MEKCGKHRKQRKTSETTENIGNNRKHRKQRKTSETTESVGNNGNNGKHRKQRKMSENDRKRQKRRNWNWWKYGT